MTPSTSSAVKAMPTRYNNINSPQRGVTLVEVTIALAVFTLIALAVSMTLMRGIDHREQSFQMYRALNAVRSVVADIQDVANQPQDLVAGVGIGAIYDRYNGATITIDDLPSGQVAIECFADEANIPAIFGGAQDLNFDNDAQDDLGNISNGSDLKLVPMTLTLTFIDGSVTQTMTVHRLITKTTN